MVKARKPTTHMEAAKLCYTIPEAAAACGVGKSLMWDLVLRHEIPSVIIGSRSRRIPVAALERYVAERMQVQHVA
jgi:excisionase family DNA binding protein